MRPAGRRRADWQPGAILRMAFSERLWRHGGIGLRPALMALADNRDGDRHTCGNRATGPMTTVDQTTAFHAGRHLLRRAGGCAGGRLGRTMSFGRVTLSSAADNKPVAMVSSALRCCERIG